MQYFGDLICRDVSSLSLNYTFKLNISKTSQWRLFSENVTWLLNVSTADILDHLHQNTTGWMKDSAGERKKQTKKKTGWWWWWRELLEISNQSLIHVILMLSDAIELHVSPLFYFIFTWNFVKTLIFPRCRRMKKSNMSLESHEGRL